TAMKLIKLLTEPPVEAGTPPSVETEPVHSPEPPPPAEKGAVDIVPLLSPPQMPGELGRLAGYRILQKLGSGGMGVVFLAEEIDLARMVALKVMKPGVGGRTARKRFQREAQLAAAVRHDHVVTLHGSGENNGLCWLAMEYLEGETL